LTQPKEGDTKVTGSLSPTPPDGSIVKIIINGTKLENMSGQLEKEKFTFSNLHPLSQYDAVEVIRSAPPPPGNESQPTTGKVIVKAADVTTNLKLTIPTSSLALDFGHQAMGSTGTSKQVTITNSTDNDVDIEDCSKTVTSANYRITSNSCAGTIAKKGSCSFNVAFAPTRVSRAGAAEQDFLVIVPKAARQKYEEIVKELNDSRQAQDKLLLDIEESNRTAKKTPKTGGTGSVLDKLTANLAEEQKQRGAAILDLEQQFQVVSLSGTPDHWKYPLTRAVVGIDLSAASSLSIKQDFFVDFDLLAPISLPHLLPKNEDPVENRLWLWFNPRITSLPQAANFSALSTIDATGSFLTPETSKGTAGDIQGLDVNGGFEIALVKPRDGIPWWSEYTNTQARLSPSLLAGVGMSTPFSTDKTDVVSQVNQSICDAFSINGPSPSVSTITRSSNQGLYCLPGASPSTSPAIVAPDGTTRAFINFFTPERSRFFRKFYAGIRLKTYFFNPSLKSECNPPVKRGESRGDCDALYDIFPGTIDLTVGKDEAVSAGKLSTWLFRLDANYPLPFYPGVHLFASMYTGLQGNKPTQPFNSYTINTPTTGTNNDSNTFRFGVQPLNRDYFRVGIGVDLVQVFKKPSSGGQPTSTTTTAASGSSQGSTP
jgi:hypothetical protein